MAKLLLMLISYSFLVWVPLWRYDRPFLSLNNGPTCSKTVAFTIAMKSPCCVMQFKVASSPDIRLTAGNISLQHLCSTIPDNKFVWQHWHLHLNSTQTFIVLFGRCGISNKIGLMLSQPCLRCNRYKCIINCQYYMHTQYTHYSLCMLTL